MSRSARAIGRSLDIYYRDAGRTARMDALNAQFLQAGALAFDIGGHVGDRTGSFLRLGARVVTVEPQPACFRALHLLYGRQPNVQLINQAVGARQGVVDLHLNTRNPTVSTASAALIKAAPSDTGWQGQVWDQTITVQATTLDHLIAAHGMPAFIKIDVEGFEAKVLLGLSQAVPALSFEVTTLQRDVAYACLHRLQRLGPYDVNLSLGEDHRLVHKRWLTPADMLRTIEALPDAANSGDIYARLPSARRSSGDPQP